MNPFDRTLAARLYVCGRPFYHPLIAGFIRQHVPQRTCRALDVACGTGLSTRILLEFADEVIGCDLSQAMLDQAFRDPRIAYACAPATDMPYPDGHFDLICLGSGLHWLDGDAFLREAARLLGQGGRIVIYDHGFAGEMACCAEYAVWHRERYLTRFPSPPRSSGTPSNDVAHALGLAREFQSNFEHYWPFSATGLVDYLLTQSNVLASVSSSEENITDVRAWLTAEVCQFFGIPQEVFRFCGSVSIIRYTE